MGSFWTWRPQVLCPAIKCFHACNFIPNGVIDFKGNMFHFKPIITAYDQRWTEIFIFCFWKCSFWTWHWQDLGSRFPQYGRVRISYLGSAILLPGAAEWLKVGGSPADYSFFPPPHVPPTPNNHWDRVKTAPHMQSCLCPSFSLYSGHHRCSFYMDSPWIQYWGSIDYAWCVS